MILDEDIVRTADADLSRMCQGGLGNKAIRTILMENLPHSFAVEFMKDRWDDDVVDGFLLALIMVEQQEERNKENDKPIQSI